MRKENLGQVEGVVDVGIIVPLCFDNPLREDAVDFVSEILSQRRRAVIPITSVVGTYHIATRYLKVSKVAVKKILDGLLQTRSPALYPQITIELALDAIEYATIYAIESWDGYLLSLAKSLNAQFVFSLDEELAKIREVNVINPFPKETVEAYHSFIRRMLGAKET